jgi:hypothetical protein
MSGELIKAIDEAIQKSAAWHVNGWRVRFGQRQTEVNSLKEALALPNTFVNRLEAVAYWNRVQIASDEAVEWGRKAKAAAEAGRMAEAEEMVYYAIIIEKPMHGDRSPTWQPVHSLFKSALAA